MPLSNSSEREFFQLAGTWLASRFCVMGGKIEGRDEPDTASTMEFHMLGMHDYGWSLRDFATKGKANPNHSERYKPD